MTTYYIDTCALAYRYLTGTPTSNVDTIMNSSQNDVFTGELTMLEWSSTLGKAVRRREIKYKVFKQNELALFNDIAEERLIIFHPESVLDRARALIEYIGVIEKRDLLSNDAIHLATGVELSSRLGKIIEFVTSDQGLHSIADSFDVFRPHIKSLYFPP